MHDTAKGHLATPLYELALVVASAAIVSRMATTAAQAVAGSESFLWQVVDKDVLSGYLSPEVAPGASLSDGPSPEVVI